MISSSQKRILGVSLGKVWRPVFKSLRVGAYGLIGKSARPFPGPSRNLRGLAMSIENLPGEEWLPVIGYESLYSVSNMGRIKSHPRQCWNGKVWWTMPEREMHQYRNSNGPRPYMYVTLNRDGNQKNHYVHRLVASLFVSNVTPSMCVEVNHIDGNKCNNHARNLEWCTRAQNQHHASMTGLSPKLRGAEHWKSVPVEVVDRTGTVIGRYDGMRDAARALGIAKPSKIYPEGLEYVPRKGARFYFRRAPINPSPCGTVASHTGYAHV